MISNKTPLTFNLKTYLYPLSSKATRIQSQIGSKLSIGPLPLLEVERTYRTSYTPAPRIPSRLESRINLPASTLLLPKNQPKVNPFSKIVTATHRLRQADAQGQNSNTRRGTGSRAESRNSPVVRPPLHLHLSLYLGPKHGGRVCSPTLHPRKSGAELQRGRSGDQRGSAALPVPNHHHGKLETLNLTIPKNGRTRVGRR